MSEALRCTGRVEWRKRLGVVTTQKAVFQQLTAFSLRSSRQKRTNGPVDVHFLYSTYGYSPLLGVFAVAFGDRSGTRMNPSRSWTK
jgi:hypothetical protein